MLWTFFFFFSSRRRHTRFKCDWSSDVCSSDLIDEQHARFSFITQSTKERSLREEIERVEAPSDFVPIFVKVFSLSFKKQLLQGLVKFSDRLVFRDTDVALETLHCHVGSGGHCVGEFGFAASRRPLNQERLLHAGCEIHNRKRDGIDDVPRSP